MLSQTFLFLVLGLIVGSFLNVLVYRLRDAETLLGRSFCRHCKHQIRWYDNVPLISFVILRGLCRDCETKISWQYPLVELLTGVLFSLVGYFFFFAGDSLSWLETAWLLGVLSSLIVIAAYDLRNMEIPISMLIVGAFLTYVFLAIYFIFVPEPFLASRLWYGFLGGAIVAGFFFLLVFLSRETWMGWGDVWFGFIVGSIVGLPLILPMLTLSFGGGAVIGILAIVSGGKNMKSQIPFAPFLAGGTLLTLFLSQAFPFFFRFFIW
jgi:prepilin signal peptidase PulO-like enzyme (type II secretory pathway)